jgi:actin-like ATPase involved in cell morphogenesis
MTTLEPARLSRAAPVNYGPLHVTSPWRRRIRDGAIAIDLGTARTQISLSHTGIVLDEPTLTAYSVRGDVIAAGRDAWVAAELGPARLRRPVRGGVVRDPVGCVHTVRLLLRKAGLTATDGRDIAVSLPATADARDKSVLTAVMASATGGRIWPVESTLAASIGTGIGIGADAAPHIVCDMGAGVTELAVIADGHFVSGSALRMGIRDYDDEPERAVRRVAQLLRRVLDDLPDPMAADAAAGELLLVGGGAYVPELVAMLSAALQMPIHIPDHPRQAVANGLGRCLTGPTLVA